MAKRPSYLDDIARREREVQAEIKRLNHSLHAAPGRMGKHNNTLEPPEDISSKRQSRKIRVAAAGRDVKNVRRELRENTLMLCLLIACIVASFTWILSLLHAS